MTTDGLGLGIYTVPQASRLTRVPKGSIRQWLWGYRYNRSGEMHEVAPLWAPQYASVNSEKFLGFRDLIEIRFVHAFRGIGISLQRIREAVDRAERLLQTRYPFSSLEFKTDGKEIFADILEGDDERILMALKDGQLLFTFILKDLYSALQYEDGEPILWKPLGSERTVLVDPARNFGQPVVEEGVPTDVLSLAFKAEESEESVAKWFDVSEAAVRDAVEFERSLAA